jgi:hypothetical protein
MTPLIEPEVLQRLTPEERGRRGELATIVVGKVTSLRAGKALREVRDRRLYRETHTSLGAWAREVCGIKDRARIYQPIHSADVHEAAAEQGIEVSNERMMFEGRAVEHPETGEPTPYFELPREHRASALAMAGPCSAEARTKRTSGAPTTRSRWMTVRASCRWARPARCTSTRPGTGWK